MGSSYGIHLVGEELDEGIRYIHTSSSYQEKHHEELLGRVFKHRPRSSFTVGESPDLPYLYVRFRGRSVDLGSGADSQTPGGSRKCNCVSNRIRSSVYRR
jgi:hypothetical protein